MKRTLVVALLVAPALATAAPSSASTSYYVPRIGYSSLRAPGTGDPVAVCGVANIHGIASVVPNPRAGYLTSVTLDLGQHNDPEGTGVANIEVHRRGADGLPGQLLSTVDRPINRLRATAGYQTFRLTHPVYVGRGQLMLVLTALSPTGCWSVLSAPAPGNWMYGWHSGVWMYSYPGQVQVLTTLLTWSNRR